MSLGVYLVGALDPDERAAVEAHLQDCVTCREELAQLAALPSMLAQLSIDDFPLEPLEAPEHLFDRVAAVAREEHERTAARRQRHYRRLTAVAAAVVLIVGATVGSLIAFGGHHSGGAAISATRGHVFSQTEHNVTMRVSLAAQTTGTGLKVTVSGLPRDEHCQLIAFAKDGSRDVAGRWDATYSGWAQETGSTRITQSELSKLVLVGTGGKELVTVPV
jgi:hypothetical protein